MALAGRNKIGIDLEIVAFDTYFTVDNRAAARMVRETEGDLWFVGHNNFLSTWQKLASFKQFKAFKPFNRCATFNAFGGSKTGPDKAVRRHRNAIVAPRSAFAILARSPPPFLPSQRVPRCGPVVRQ